VNTRLWKQLPFHLKIVRRIPGSGFVLEMASRFDLDLHNEQ
jgi:hypothetical protein